mmetsp:Transcript_7086/g.28992  ORF Transcript_7086/g.28992 Transcript_7086/m.28992 type:complete len:285 (-) Transcript_7086:162-1016(-)
MHHHYLLLQHRRQRQVLEHAREEVRHLVAVLVSRLPIEAVYSVHVFGLVVAAREVHGCRVRALPRQQRDDALAREAAAVHEVAVEEVGILHGRQAVELPDVEQVVVLAVHVAAHGEVVALLDGDVHHRAVPLEHILRRLQQLVDVAPVQGLLCLEVRDHLDDEIARQAAVGTARSVVRVLDGHRAPVGKLGGRRLGVADGLLEAQLLQRLLALAQLSARVGVLRLEAHHAPEVGQPLAELGQLQVRAAAAVVALHIRRVDLDGHAGILDGAAEILELELRERAV